MMKKILVGLDGSPRASGVLAYAGALAGVTGAKLVLVRSVGIPADMALAWPASDEPLEVALRAQAQTYLDTCAATVPSGRLDGVRVVLGVPWEAICGAAVHENADLIVVGSHGYGGIDHLLGTTAARIVNHADRPVLVVRPLPGGISRTSSVKTP
jgi:nucleotide-binding universal stress UspA family protein